MHFYVLESEICMGILAMWNLTKPVLNFYPLEISIQPFVLHTHWLLRPGRDLIHMKVDRWVSTAQCCPWWRSLLIRRLTTLGSQGIWKGEQVSCCMMLPVLGSRWLLVHLRIDHDCTSSLASVTPIWFSLAVVCWAVCVELVDLCTDSGCAV